MNLHVPQSEEARAEATLLMRVQDQMISPRYGGPIIGAIRDFITGAFMLTRDGSTLTKDEFANLAMIGGYEGPLPEPAVTTKDGQNCFRFSFQGTLTSSSHRNGTRLQKARAGMS
jgi:DNA-directed RNA polymerase subunit A'